MSVEETNFLRAIITAPEDEALLAVFADWLEEHGRWPGHWRRRAVGGCGHEAPDVVRLCDLRLRGKPFRVVRCSSCGGRLSVYRITERSFSAARTYAWATERALRQPPRCLSGFAVRSESEAVRAVRAWGGVEGAVFELLPPNPGAKPVLLGHYLNNIYWPPGSEGVLEGRILVSPLAMRWEPSGQVVELFDGTRHGYNPEIGGRGGHILVDTDPVEYEWPRRPFPDPVFLVCLSHTFYPDVELVDDEAVRPEDFFDWFTLVAWCRSDGAVRIITEFECA